MVIDPATLMLIAGGAEAGLGIFQALTGNQAQQQQYKNQLAMQAANDRFAKWQAGFNLRLGNEEARFQHWTATVKYNQDLAYVRSLKNYELLQEISQAEQVRDTRIAATASYINDSQAISQQAQEASMQDAVASMQYNMAALQARARVDASGKTGQSIDLLINDYARQAGDYEAIQQMNQKFRKRQYSREQAAQVTEWLSRYNSQQFYKAKPYQEGMKPFVPLPGLLMPQGPSFTGGAPSQTAMWLNIGSSVLGGVQTGLSVRNSLMNTGRPKQPPPP